VEYNIRPVPLVEDLIRRGSPESATSSCASRDCSCAMLSIFLNVITTKYLDL
jgi:hypothetical protein